MIEYQFILACVIAAAIECLLLESTEAMSSSAISFFKRKRNDPEAASRAARRNQEFESNEEKILLDSIFWDSSGTKRICIRLLREQQRTA